MSEQSTSLAQIQFDILKVIRFRDISPKTRSITLKGSKAITSNKLSPGSHLKVLLPREGQRLPVLPTVGENGRFIQPAEAERAIVRTYTLRNIIEETGEIEVDFVLHGEQGPASAWASQVNPGDFIGVAYREGLVSYNADWYLFAGDETALPAISAIIEHLPPSANGVAWIEVANHEEEQQILTESKIDIKWLYRNGVPAGHGSMLVDATKSVELPEGHDVKRYVWVGAEFDTARELRRYFKNQYRLNRNEMHATAYWKRDMDEDQFHDLRHLQMDQNNE